MNNFSEKVNFIWSVADLIRDTFKRSKYQDVILPLTILRRIDCVLQPTKEHVLEINARLKGKLDNLAPQLCKASGFSFYNTSLYDFERLLSDAPHLAANLKAYINGFSDNMREVIRLMVNLLLAQDQDALKQNHIVRTVYDPCCGSGGMLTIAKERMLEINSKAEVHLFGQELNGETFAICKSDLYRI
jgi:type I restriction-modification system DNA methylase subunit